MSEETKAKSGGYLHHQPDLPCAHCGAPASTARATPVPDDLVRRHPSLRGCFIIQPVCGACMQRMVEPQEHGICALRQQMGSFPFG
ncbi:MAG: hypothetical protein HC884_10210 [Chloroflexaceae bacterium]|nr:hypothetical protein [Chloroflexaceae bacterium]